LTITKIIDITNESIRDLGSGAGFPGLVLAICFPNTNLTLIESNGKKCNFLNIVKERLSLKNVNVINTRVEEYAKENRELFDVVTARAVAPIKHLLEYGVPLVKIEGYFIAMKSNVEEETKNIDNYYNKLYINLEEKKEFNLPKENSLRTLLKYQKKDITNIKYPRRYSEIIKKDI
jgi:16S rRNA (guanine527-N7)-methyltransferase